MLTRLPLIPAVLALVGCGAAGQAAVAEEAQTVQCAEFEAHNQCRPAVELLAEAQHTCGQMGREVQSFQRWNRCGQHKFQDMKYQCCGQPAPSCWPEQSNGGGCYSQDAWWQWAQQSCAQRGAQASNLQVWGGCGGGWLSAASWDCCPETIPPPPGNPPPGNPPPGNPPSPGNPPPPNQP
jgi:hypothetical protein